MLATVLDAFAPVRCLACGVGGNALCASCAGELKPPLSDAAIAGVDAAFAPWEYDGVARALLLGLKLRAKRPYAEPLARAMVGELHRCGSRGTLLTWVPGRRRDIARRGFDHAELLARSVGRATGLPRAPVLIRTQDTRDQTTLGAAARRHNLIGAFAARSCSGTMLLVDDLITTGATAAACARALRRAGAKRVEVLAACRA